MSFASITQGMQQQKERQRKTRAENARLYSEYVQANPNASIEDRERFRDNLSRDGFYTALIPSREQMTKNLELSQKKLAAEAQQRQLNNLRAQTETRNLLTDQIADQLIVSPDYETASSNILKDMGPDAPQNFGPIIQSEATRNAATIRAQQKVLEQNEDRIAAGILQGLTPEEINGTLGIKNPILKEGVATNYQARRAARAKEVRDQLHTEILEISRTSENDEVFDSRVDAAKRKYGIYADEFPAEELAALRTAHEQRMAAVAKAEAQKVAQAFTTVHAAIPAEQLLNLDSEDAAMEFYRETMTAAGHGDWNPADYKPQILRKWNDAQEAERVKIAEEANIRRPQEAKAKYEAGLVETEASRANFKTYAEAEIARAVGDEDDQKPAFGAINLGYLDLTSKFGFEHTPEFQREFILSIVDAGGATESDVLGFIRSDEAFGMQLHQRLSAVDPAYARVMDEMQITSLTRLSDPQKQAQFRRLYRAARQQQYIQEAGGISQYPDQTASQTERTVNITDAVTRVEGNIAEIDKRIQSAAPQNGEEAEELRSAIETELVRTVRQIKLISEDINDLRKFKRTETQTAELQSLEKKLMKLTEAAAQYKQTLTAKTQANIVEVSADQRDKIARGAPEFTPAQIEFLTPRAQEWAQIMGRQWIMGKERNALARIRIETAKALGLDPRKDEKLIEQTLSMMAQQLTGTTRP